MLALTRGKVIHLTTTRCECPRVLTLDAEQDQLGDIAEVESDPSTIRAAVLSHLVPYDVGFVPKSPFTHYGKTVRQQCVWAPQIKVSRRCGNMRNRKSHDLMEGHCRITRQPFVLRCNFSGLIGELPRRIGEDCREASFL